jgi:hypothetical protein
MTIVENIFIYVGYRPIEKADLQEESFNPENEESAESKY